jgi:hypothetical protein
MMVVSFYTSEYAGEVKGFVEACNEHGMRHCVTAVESRRTWRLNVGRKPVFLLEQLALHKQPVLWVDIDGRFRRPFDLELNLTDRDFGAWFIPNRKMRSADIPGGPNTGHDGIASGTMWFNYTPMSLRMLEIWVQEEHGQGKYGQKVLGEVWHYHRPDGLSTYRLPQEYCKVFDVPWFERDYEPVAIEHMQASRRLRTKVK